MSSPIKDFLLSEKGQSLLVPSSSKQQDELLSSPTSSVSLIQSLWAGYGQIIRVKDFDSKNLVIKNINCPLTLESFSPENHSNNVSHTRKINSYEIEINFYQQVLMNLSNNDSFPRSMSFMRTAKCFEAGDLVTKNNNNATTSSTVQKYLALEDLAASGFSRSVSRFTRPIPKFAVSAALKWLSQFHALFLNDGEKFIFSKSLLFSDNPQFKTPEDLINSGIVWSQGCYWNFGTRQDEWNKMKKMLSEENEKKDDDEIEDHQIKGLRFLTERAKDIDDSLLSTPFSSLCHGDPKLENMCFGSDENDKNNKQDVSCSAAAFVDFQYVGFGNPIVDVAGFSTYIIEASLENDEEIDLEISKFVGEYRSHLLNSIETLCERENDISANEKSDIIKNVVQHWIGQFPLAVADYCRFYVGWKKDMSFEKLPKWQKKMCATAEMQL